ncbi:MAG: RNA-binding S4 domain-containing protein [Candidatus Izemoplasmatales bacterium]|nr:RNA-binding S4 domain-containing protein [bacterium]MDZ4196944.1 RNA-binding S4 domain-containing protein [Candidatus Izemoplasmatales bacterium]
MRLDKYLKTSRIFKRRTIAKEVSANDRIEVNQKTAKPSTTIKIGDIITIHYGERLLVVKVLSVEENVKKAEATLMYEVIEDKKNTEPSRI